MLIIIDKRIPEKAKENLSKYGEIIEFSTTGITYEAISGHPDVFFCKTDKTLIIAANLPQHYKNILKNNNISFIEGMKKTGQKYPATAYFNAVISENYIIHNFDFTDEKILKNTSSKRKIKINQAYSRCSILPLKKNNFITSDKGIQKTLSENKLNYLFVSPEKMILPGFSNGFIGGCCGVFENKIFLMGSLKYFPDGEKFKQFADKLGYEIIELYDGPLFDGCSILFVN